MSLSKTKALRVFVISLFIGASILPIVNGNYDFSNLFDNTFVDDDANSEWYEYPNHFHKISTAIENVKEGGNVTIYKGCYQEEGITIDKTLNLIGNGSRIDWNTTIDGAGGGAVLLIKKTDYVNIAGFHLFNSSNGDTSAAIKTIEGSDYTKIYENKITDSGNSIFIQDGNNAEIYDNIIESNYHNGIILGGTSSYNIIRNNNISNNGLTQKLSGDGIEIRSKSNNNVIFNNVIKENQVDGIWLDSESNHNYVDNNTLSKNNYVGIHLDGSYDNKFRNNTIKSNGFELPWNYPAGGFLIYDMGKAVSRGNQIYHNNFIGNRGGPFNRIRNAYDNSKWGNEWDSGDIPEKEWWSEYPYKTNKGGNFWSDYESRYSWRGAYLDSERMIWSMSYEIISSNFLPITRSKDRYPFSEENGWQNDPPNKPYDFQGIKEGKVDKYYYYSATANDPEGDKIYYNFSWGDGQYTKIGLFSSGVEGGVTHSWKKSGTYNITVQAIDEVGSAGKWREPFVVNII